MMLFLNEKRPVSVDATRGTDVLPTRLLHVLSAYY